MIMGLYSAEQDFSLLSNLFLTSNENTIKKLSISDILKFF